MQADRKPTVRLLLTIERNDTSIRREIIENMIWLHVAVSVCMREWAAILFAQQLTLAVLLTTQKKRQMIVKANDRTINNSNSSSYGMYVKNNNNNNNSCAAAIYKNRKIFEISCLSPGHKREFYALFGHMEESKTYSFTHWISIVSNALEIKVWGSEECNRRSLA